MSDPVGEIQELIYLVHDILQVVGAESLVGDRAHELVYQDENIFLLFNEATGKTWAAVPIWNEEQQERVWESVLDIPSDEAPPEKFFTRLIPDSLDQPWPQYLEELRQQHHTGYLRWDGFTITHRRERFVRQWLNCWDLDLRKWLSDLEHLKYAGVQSAEIAIQMFRHVLVMPEAVKAELLDASWEASAWNQ